MALTFPDENVNLLVALPPLFIIPTSVLVGKLSYYISRKTLLTVGQILYIIGGVGAAWFTDFNHILGMRVILGIGCGIVYPIVPTLIAQFYSGHERVTMMGLANAVGAIIAMGMSLVAGVLATIGWHLPFYVDLFFVVVLVMQLKFLPKVPPEKDMHDIVSDVSALNDAERKIGFQAYLCMLLMFISMTFGMVFLLKMAIFVDEKGIGDAALAGVINSCQIGAAFLFALTFPFVFKHLKRYTIILPIFAASLSFIAIAIAEDVSTVIFGASIFGCYLGYSIPYFQTTISGYVHPARRTFALTLLSAALFGGQACSTPFVAFIETLIGTNTPFLFFIMSICSVTLACFVIIYLVATRNRFKEYPYADVAELQNDKL